MGPALVYTRVAVDKPQIEQPAPEVSTGLPLNIFERLRDIREAEQILVASNLEIGVAKAQFFRQSP